MKRILFVAQNMAVGGIQTSLINLLKELCASGEYEIHLFAFGEGALMAQLPEQVRVSCGGKCLRLTATPFACVLAGGKPWDILLRIWLTLYARVLGSERLYRKLLKKYRADREYHAAISYFNDVPTGRFNRGTNLYVSEYVCAGQKLAWIHTDPDKGGFDREYCRRLYAGFDQIVCVSRAVKDRFDAFLPEYADRTVVCYNRFPEQEIQNQGAEFVPFSDDKFHIVTVARLDNHTKRIDGIVRLCRRLKDDSVDGFVWHIVGDGPDGAADRALAHRLDVDDVLCFEGEKTNPYPYIKQADLFALYSAYEGFPMVVGEAQVLHTPVLTTNYAAAQEQIAPGQGEIAADDEAFYHKLKRIICQMPSK